MTNTQTTRTFRIRYDGAYDEAVEYITTDRRDANETALLTMGRVDEKINGRWVWLGQYDYVDFMRDMWAGKEIEDFEKKWVDSNDIPDLYTDKNNKVQVVYKKRH